MEWNQCMLEWGVNAWGEGCVGGSCCVCGGMYGFGGLLLVCRRPNHAQREGFCATKRTLGAKGPRGRRLDRLIRVFLTRPRLDTRAGGGNVSLLSALLSALRGSR